MARENLKSYAVTGRPEEIKEFSEKVKSLAARNNCSAFQAINAVLKQSSGEVVVDSGIKKEDFDAVNVKNQQLADTIKKLQEQNQRLAEQIEQLNANEQSSLSDSYIKKIQQWIIPAALGAVCLELIANNGELYKNIRNVEDACNYLLTPYWRKGVFKPSQEEINNYLAIFSE